MALAEQHLASNDTLTFPRKVKFRFNKNDKTGFQRSAVETVVKVLSTAGLIDIIQLGATADETTDQGKKDKATLDYVIEVLGDAVVNEVRGYVSDNLNAAQDTIPWGNYTFAAIANMPAGIRGASGIAKELWDKFAADYVAVIASTGLAAEIAAARVAVFVQKFRPLTGNPDRKSIIENLMGTLVVYMEKTSNGEEFSSILEFLNKKADELKKEDTLVTAGALGFA